MSAMDSIEVPDTQQRAPKSGGHIFEFVKNLHLLLWWAPSPATAQNHIRNFTASRARAPARHAL